MGCFKHILDIDCGAPSNWCLDCWGVYFEESLEDDPDTVVSTKELYELFCALKFEINNLKDELKNKEEDI